MTIYKLRILPLSLLVIGLTTLTSGCKKKDMSLKLNEPRNIRGVVSYKRSFPDLNDAHLEVAKKIGIRPLADREAAEDMKEKLTHITDNEFYVVDSLTHSIPYLVPRASALLDTIGSNFLDSLAARSKPQPGNYYFRTAYRKRCETPPPSQRKCFRQLGTLLWSHL